ncbi:hypothetical protein K435DRAFT_613258, partial [Dendrothele bispora CBS 962.96]
MWLKRYLAFGPNRPLWAFLADALLANNTPASENNVPKDIRANCYLQSWTTSTSPRSSQPTDLLKMIKTGQKYGVRIQGLAFDRDILRDMPIWHHIFADPKIRRLTNSSASNCLRFKHNLQTVGEAEDLAAPLIRVNEAQLQHRSNNQCECRDCIEIQEITDCEHPHHCMLRAQELLDTLPPKWDPRAEQPADYESSFTSSSGLQGEDIFDYRLTTAGNLSDLFRVFTDKDHNPINETFVRRVQPEGNEGLVTVATDGSCIDNGQDTAKAGAGIYFAKDDPRNKSLKLPKMAGGTKLTQSNQAAELLAVKVTPELVPVTAPL